MAFSRDKEDGTRFEKRITYCGDYPVARSHHVSTFLTADSCLYVHGGTSTNGNVLNDLLVFNWPTRTWNVVRPDELSSAAAGDSSTPAFSPAPSGLTPSAAALVAAQALPKSSEPLATHDSDEDQGEEHEDSDSDNRSRSGTGNQAEQQGTATAVGTPLLTSSTSSMSSSATATKALPGFDKDIKASSSSGDSSSTATATVKTAKRALSAHLKPCQPLRRFAHTVVVYSDVLWYFGGIDEKGQARNTLVQFHPNLRRWSTVQALKGRSPSSRHSHTAVVHNHTMYIYGGLDSHSRNLDDLHAFHFPSVTWKRISTTTPIPRSRFGHSAVVYKDRMFVYGGAALVTHNQVATASSDAKSVSGKDDRDEVAASLQAAGLSAADVASLALLGPPATATDMQILTDSQSKGRRAKLLTPSEFPRYWNQHVLPTGAVCSLAVFSDLNIYDFASNSWLSLDANECGDLPLGLPPGFDSHLSSASSSLSSSTASSGGGTIGPSSGTALDLSQSGSTGDGDGDAHPGHRVGHSLQLVHTRLYLVGGSSNDDIFEYHLDRHRWHRLGQLGGTSTRFSLAAATDIDRQFIFFFGGKTSMEKGENCNDLDVLCVDHSVQEQNAATSNPFEWESTVWKKHPRLLRLRHELQQALSKNNQPSFARQALVGLTEDTRHLSNQLMLELIIEHLQISGQPSVGRILEREASFDYQGAVYPGESRLMALFKLAKRRFRSTSEILDTPLDELEALGPTAPNLFQGESEVLLAGKTPIVQQTGTSATELTKMPDQNIWKDEGDASSLCFVRSPDTGKQVISSASLNKLLNALIFAKGGDLSERRSFFCTYRCYTTPKRLLHKLFQRFRLPKSMRSGPQEAELLRESGALVCSAIEFWLETKMHDFVTESDLLYDLTSWIDGPLTQAGLLDEAANLRRAISSLLARYERRLENRSELVLLEPKVPKNIFSRDLTLSDISPMEIARQLTILEFEAFSKVQSIELIVFTHGNRRMCPNLNSIIRRAEDLADWTTALILRNGSQAQLFTKMISVAKYLLLFKNFQTLQGLITGIMSPLFSALHQPKSGVSPKSLETLERLKRATPSRENVVTYRADLRTLYPPCIPSISLCIESLQDLHGHGFVSNAGIIQFHQLRELARLQDDIAKFQAHPYPFNPVSQVARLLQIKDGSQMLASHLQSGDSRSPH